MREQQHFANRVTVRHQHHQSVNAESYSACWWHSVAHGAQVILINGCSIVGIVSKQLSDIDEALFLVNRVVQLGEGISEFHPGYIELKALDMQRIIRNALGKRRYIARVIQNK